MTTRYPVLEGCVVPYTVRIGYYTGGRSVRLGIFTRLTYFVESAGRGEIQRQSSTEPDYLCDK